MLLVSDDTDAGRTAAAHGVAFRLLADLLQDALDSRHPAPPAPANPGTPAVDPVCLIYTSGTTALPKAVVSTHQQVLFAASAIHACLNYRADDVIYCPLPLSFDYGLYQLYLAAPSGARLHLGTAAEAGPPLLSHLEKTRATVLPGVPSIADRPAWLVRRSPGALRNLRLLTNTGAALSEGTMRRPQAGPAPAAHPGHVRPHRVQTGGDHAAGRRSGAPRILRLSAARHPDRGDRRRGTAAAGR